MEKPLDGMNSPTEVGQRIVDKPDHPLQGVSYQSEVNGKPFSIEGITKN